MKKKWLNDFNCFIFTYNVYTFQVMVLGDSGVGKTCLLVRFRDDMFLGGNYISTVGVDFRVRRSIVFGSNMNRGTRLTCQWIQYEGHSFVLIQ